MLGLGEPRGGLALHYRDQRRGRDGSQRRVQADRQLSEPVHRCRSDPRRQGLDGLVHQASLPPPLTINPSASAGQPAADRLPSTLGAAIARMEQSAVLREAMGNQFFDAFVGVRRSEDATLGSLSPLEAVRAHRWWY